MTTLTEVDEAAATLLRDSFPFLQEDEEDGGEVFFVADQ